MSRRWKNNLLNWDPVSDRIIVARFKCKIRNITVVQCYAPNEVANKEEKQRFYAQLREVFASIKKQDIVILMGDLNPKVGVRNEGLEQVMGKNGKGDRNENGEMFVDFCMEQELAIGRTLFKHKECHKVTWVSPDVKTENQINHIAISQKWRKSLLETRNKRGADIGSDHHLVVAGLRLKVSASKKPFIEFNKKFDVQK
jgi:exonuclease III